MRPNGTRRPPTNGRIVHVSTSDLSVKYLLRNQLHRLQRAGYEVHALSAPGEHQHELNRETFVYSCIPMARRIFPPADVYSFYRLKQYFQNGDFDLVHMHTNKAGILGCWAADAVRTPVVVSTIHGFYFHDNMHPTVRRFYVRVYRETLKRVHRVFMQSAEDVRTAIAERIVPEDRLIHIGNGIDLRRFDGTREQLLSEGFSLRRVSGIPDTALLIGIVARLNNEKGVAELINAFANVRAKSRRDVHLVIIGDGPSRRRFQTQAMALGLGTPVHFVGFQENVEAWMKALDIYALPSYREGFPRTLCEAFAIGVACVATDIRGCRELITDNSTGLLVPPRDSAALAAAIRRLVDNDDLRGRIGAAAQRHASTHLDEQRIVDRIIDEYRSLGVHPANTWPAAPRPPRVPRQHDPRSVARGPRTYATKGTPV